MGWLTRCTLNRLSHHMVMTSYSDWNEIVSGTLFEIAFRVYGHLGYEKTNIPKKTNFGLMSMQCANVHFKYAL